jgi:hypothetical protein
MSGPAQPPADDSVMFQETGEEEVTPEAAAEYPGLLANPHLGIEDILDDVDRAAYEELEQEAAEYSALAVEEPGAPAGGGAAEPEITRHQQDALRLAVSQKGRYEILGTNCNPYSRYFELPCQFWCADFVSYCVDKTGVQDKRLPWGYPSAVKNIRLWGQRNSRIFPQPKRGDIFILQKKNVHTGKMEDVHTGFVTRVHGSGFMTIEGNTTGPDGNPDHAVYVWPHSRNVSSGGFSFVRWHF